MEEEKSRWWTPQRVTGGPHARKSPSSAATPWRRRWWPWTRQYAFPFCFLPLMSSPFHLLHYIGSQHTQHNTLFDNITFYLVVIYSTKRFFLYKNKDNYLCSMWFPIFIFMYPPKKYVYIYIHTFKLILIVQWVRFEQIKDPSLNYISSGLRQKLTCEHKLSWN